MRGRDCPTTNATLTPNKRRAIEAYYDNIQYEAIRGSIQLGNNLSVTFGSGLSTQVTSY